MTLRDWLFGPPRTDAELQLGLPPCGHRGSIIAPAMEDPDQRIACCHCGKRLPYAEPGRAHLHRRKTEEERRQRRVAEFEDLKAWADSLPELVLRLRHGEAQFAAVYEPATPMPGGHASTGFYGMLVPMDRLMEASGDLPEEQMDRFVEEVGRFVKVRPGGGELRSGRPNPVPFDGVYLKGRFRPEVYTVGYPDGRGLTENAAEHLDWLVRERERLEARNMPAGTIFRTRALVVHVKVSAWWTMHGQSRPSYSSMDKTGFSLSPVRIGVRV